MNISDYIAFGSLLISGITAVCSALTYRKYDRRLKEQQAQINEYTIYPSHEVPDYNQVHCGG